MFANPPICSKFTPAKDETLERNRGANLRLVWCWRRSPLTSPLSGGPVKQVVLLWLKHPQRTADRERLMHAAHLLRRMPGVVAVSAGRATPPIHPAPPSNFDLAIVITFRDRAALERYQNDRRHVTAMRRYLKPLVRSYEIYNLTDR